MQPLSGHIHHVYPWLNFGFGVEISVRPLFVFAFLACVCAALPLRADFSVNTVRSALDADNYVLLEEEFQTAFEEAAKTKNFRPLRNTYSQLFVTANDVRRVKAEAWLAEHPSSPFAATALAWSHYYMGPCCMDIPSADTASVCST